MKEKLITSLRVERDPGPPLIIQYYLLEEIVGRRKAYGIKIVEKTAQACAVAPGITPNKRHASKLIVRLAKGSVTPTGLADVLADLL